MYHPEDTTVPHQPGGNHDGMGQSAGTSMSLQDLYVNAVKQTFADSDRSVTLTSGSDNDSQGRQNGPNHVCKTLRS